MSTKGRALSQVTKDKIATTKRKFKPQALVSQSVEYLTRLETNPKELPTISGLALSLGISQRHLYELADTSPEVSQLLDHIRTLQEQYALTRGITNQANPVFSMFLLKSKHRYIDQPQQLNQTNNFSVSPDVLAEALKLMGKKSG